MPHIHTQSGHHDHTVSVYLFRTDFDEPKVMLHLHKKINSYMQFGGHIELHENPWQTVAHELKEESGYDLDQVLLLQPDNQLAKLTNAIVHPFPVVHATYPVPSANNHFHTDSAYAITTNEEPRNKPEDGESTVIQLFSRQEIQSLTNDAILENVREIVLYIFDTCLQDWSTIPPNRFGVVKFA